MSTKNSRYLSETELNLARKYWNQVKSPQEEAKKEENSSDSIGDLEELVASAPEIKLSDGGYGGNYNFSSINSFIKLLRYFK